MWLVGMVRDLDTLSKLTLDNGEYFGFFFVNLMTLNLSFFYNINLPFKSE